MLHCRCIFDWNIDNFIFSKLFAKGFRIARLFYFPKNSDFRDGLYSVIQIILYFCFWKDTLRNKNRCENNFHFFVFSVNAFEKPTLDDEKNWKNQGFHVFIIFFVTRKLLPGHLVLGAKTDFWAWSSGIQKSEKSKII